MLLHDEAPRPTGPMTAPGCPVMTTRFGASPRPGQPPEGFPCATCATGWWVLEGRVTLADLGGQRFVHYPGGAPGAQEQGDHQ